jgi:hypothetical protein
MIDRYAQTGEIMKYRNPSPKQSEIIKKHKRGRWCLWGDVKKLVSCADDAERMGWSKFTSASGERMVISTQADLDELIAQAKKGNQPA